VLSTLAPIHDKTPLEDYPIPVWEVQHAYKRKQAQDSRYLLDVARTQVDSVRSGPSHGKSRRKSFMILEPCLLNVPEAIYIKKAWTGSDWESRFGLSQVQDGLDQEFLEHYHVFTQSGTVDSFPDELRNTLLEILQHMEHAFSLYGMTLAFRKDGWGIGNGWGRGDGRYTSKQRELMIEAADMISGVLRQNLRGEAASRSEDETFEATAFEVASLSEDKTFEPTKVQEEVPQELLFALKSVFLPWQALFSALPAQIMTTLMGGGFFGIAGYIVVTELPLNVPGWLPFAVSCSFFFLLVPMIAYIHTKNKKKRIEYRFYTTKLEYGDDLSPKEKKRLHYKDVFGMRLRQGGSQKRHGVGTLILLTLATGDPKRSEIEVADIPNPYEVYTQVKERVNSILHEATTSTENTQPKRISTGSPLEKVGTQEPFFVLKPVFLPWVTLLSILPMLIVLSIIGFFVTAMVMGVLNTFQINAPVWLPAAAAVIGGVLFFTIPIMMYRHKKKKYEHTSYGFYATEFTGHSGTSHVEVTTIHYKNISGVSLKKGFFQKKHDLGTLFLLTKASSEAGRDIARSRIKLTDIPHPDEACTQIKALLNAC
jgi:membrane protein YdbS with pleckstrin-like domain